MGAAGETAQAIKLGPDPQSTPRTQVKIPLEVKTKSKFLLIRYDKVIYEVGDYCLFLGVRLPTQDHGGS